MKPRHILLSAYQCGLGMGSVSQIGWEWYRRLTAHHPVTLVTHVRNRAALEQAGAPLPGSEVIYIDTEWFAGPLYRLASKLFRSSEHPVFLMSSLDFYVYDWVALRTLRRRQAGAGWTVIHQPTPVSPLAATRLYRLGLPLVLGPWNGGLASPSTFPEIMRAESGWLYRIRSVGKWLGALLGTTGKARMILTATRSTRNDLPAKVQDKARFMLENGVDLEVFRPTPWPEKPSAHQPLQILFVGRLVPFKGVAMLIDAIARTRPHGPVELTLVGAGPEEGALRAQVERHGIGASVRFTGALPAAQVAAQMAACHVFCLPSVRESGGAVLLEAMASGRPVLALDHGGPAEIVDDTVGRLLAPLGHDAVVKQLTQAFVEIMNHPEDWRRRGLAGRARVEAQFGWDAKIAAACDLYQECEESSK